MAYKIGPIPLSTDNRPSLIPIYDGSGKEIAICWECAYGECEHCHNYNKCQHTHWWTNRIVSKTQSIAARDPSISMWSTGEQNGQLDLPIASGDIPQNPLRNSA